MKRIKPNSRYISFLLLLLLYTNSSCSSNYENDLIDKKESNDYQYKYRDTLYIAHWNIGHFSLGKSSSTTITDSLSNERASAYKSFLDSLNVDILGICEYNPTFNTSGSNTKEVLFDNYPFYCVGIKHNYNCNAVFSYFNISNSDIKYFATKVQTRYYILTSFVYKNIEVKLVETHLDWNQGNDGKRCRQEQISQLVETFRNDPYVIICVKVISSDIIEDQTLSDHPLLKASLYIQ